MKHTVFLIFLLTIATQYNTYSSFQQQTDIFRQAIENNQEEIRQRYGVKNISFKYKGSMIFQLENQNRENINDIISSIHNLDYRKRFCNECSTMEATNHECIECGGKCCCCYSCLLAVCCSLTNIKK